MILLTRRIETWSIFYYIMVIVVLQYYVMVIVVLVHSVTKTIVILVIIFSIMDVCEVAFFISRLDAFLYVELF